MALQKTIAYKGVNATYHKIVSMEIQWQSKVVIVTVGSYADKATRDADGKSTINLLFTGREVFAIDFTADDNAIKKCYLKIKTMPKWSNSIDV